MVQSLVTIVTLIVEFWFFKFVSWSCKTTWQKVYVIYALDSICQFCLYRKEMAWKYKAYYFNNYNHSYTCLRLQMEKNLTKSWWRLRRSHAESPPSQHPVKFSRYKPCESGDLVFHVVMWPHVKHFKGSCGFKCGNLLH